MATTFANLRVTSTYFPTANWTFGSTDTTANANAGVTITLNTNGTTSVTKEADDETLIDTTTNWYTPTTTSIGTSYWTQATLNSGNTATSGTFGSRLQLNTARAWSWDTTPAAGVKSGQVKFDFYDAAAAGNLVGTVNADFTVTPGSGFTPVTRRYASGTSVTETAPTGATTVLISVWGAGGGGARGTGTGMSAEYGATGGSGGYSQSSYSISGGQTVVYTVGTGGAGGGASAATAGTASSVVSGTKTITTLTGNGGGPGTAGISGTGGAGGTASGGTVTNTTGNNGLDWSNGPTGAAGVVGWNSEAYGAGGDSGLGSANDGSPGEAGEVIFYYT